jgi:hypothetical protein
MTALAEPSASERAGGVRVPDFFIVGHPKSGTTALYEMLRRHPQVYMPELKETRFFAHELHPGLDFSTHPATLEEYLALFAPVRPGQRAGEASPSYLRSRLAAARIAALQPDAAIIAILREPASFLRSLHLELLQDHVESEKDFRKALAADRLRRAEDASGEHPGHDGVRYSSDRVEYVAQLRRYEEAFGRERMLVLIYDDFRAENEATVRRILRFLGVDDTVAVEPSEANPTVRVRSPAAYRLVRSLYLGQDPVARALKRPLTALTPRRLRREGLRAVRRRLLYTRPQAPDEELMLDLRRRFKHEVVALSAYLDRDLVSLWGYDRLD